MTVRRVSAGFGNGYVGYDAKEGAIVVAFAGTDSSSIENWISNLDAFKTDYTDCEVHDGFMSSYAGISADVRLFVGELLATHVDAPIWIADLMSLGHNVQRVMTFGQPRVGNDQSWASSTVPSKYFTQKQ
ncbi:lipase family protein [Nannochloropsis gaditana CCMP526]|uniref:lipase family protein n=1 Tax=Nannochloropsis gaditana (strain CCMP526) TaxID=1093141 RepID=UPI00029F7542|nr:lipase family protein [Nannochloropsis gaditana CCMP526]EKU23459.1 lipase family protein [Nannochloropsis gaditana CCMP526]|eukprot:XP_005852368.1 lipase family protein [Nannochloropsis gaditana CCMP526]